ncbi:hypothetical protein BGX29_004209 [Mortierella sp. GBA35]|nr:hypothetical protein BGX29_004209 [Mortierella sp. GBA35]
MTAAASADSSCASSSGPHHSRNSGFTSAPITTGGIGGFGSRMQQQQHYTALGGGGGPSPDMNRRNSTEMARTAAATAIVNTLSRGEASIPRGDSPYIPSSLSMLFSDPEIMEVGHSQQQQGATSQLTLSHSGSAILAASEDGRDTEDHEDDSYGEESRLLRYTRSGSGSEARTTAHATATVVSAIGRAMGGRGGGEDGLGYGYEIVQEDQEDIFRPYVAMMAREDYLAPHEPSSSSPLFPSPLTTLGPYSSGTSMLDIAEDQQSRAAGRMWRDYGTMMENGQFRQPNTTTPLNQSHAAYYHAVSNYHYSSHPNQNDEHASSSGSRSGGGVGPSSSSGGQVNTCGPTGHYAVPESWQWRRHRGRGASQQSSSGGGIGTSNGNGAGNGNNGSSSEGGWSRRRRNADGSDDHWLWGM